MPLYEYACKGCETITEQIEKMDVEEIECPCCGKIAKRIMSSTSFRLKGEGWESDGYQKEFDLGDRKF